MRTTLDLDEDVLYAVKELAATQKRTAGQVLSDLARQSLRPSGTRRRKRNGFTLMPRNQNAKPVTMELVNRLRDEIE